ncbi:MAG: aminotransferase class V-fold PLP-dependent enzyme [Deltaproteobacteria bacterium]|nr:aminotransferase class V-fold PLP-dependent enzyme [Deltaproteobacteria bacterium]
MRAHWMLDPEIVFLNHGSFGACPRVVLEQQQRWRERMEREPVRFFVRELEALVDAARTRLSHFVRADPADLVFVVNATHAVNAVLRSLDLKAGDELLVTDHEYNACRNAMDFAAARAGARVVVAGIPFPLREAGQVAEAVLARVTRHTRLALLDHVTSQTGLVLPVSELVAALAERGVDCLVDGAHALGMLELDLPAIGAAYYTANCHKWLCAPKSAALLWARRDRQPALRPLCISHGASSARRDRSRFQLEFDWEGTRDPSPALCVPAAIDFVESLLPGGFPALARRNRQLVLEARRLLCARMGTGSPCPDEMVGSLASLPLPDGSDAPPVSALYTDALQDRLLERGIEVPVIPWPAPPRRLLRISAQAYNRLEDYVRLADALEELLPAA